MVRRQSNPRAKSGRQVIGEESCPMLVGRWREVVVRLRGGTACKHKCMIVKPSTGVRAHTRRARSCWIRRRRFRRREDGQQEGLDVVMVRDGMSVLDGTAFEVAVAVTKDFDASRTRKAPAASVCRFSSLCTRVTQTKKLVRPVFATCSSFCMKVNQSKQK